MKGPKLYPTKKGTYVVAWPEVVRGKIQRKRKEYSDGEKARAHFAELKERFPVVGAAGLSMDAEAREDFHAARRILPEGVSMADAARAYVKANPSAERAAILPLAEEWLIDKERKDPSIRTSQGRRNRLMGFLSAQALVYVSDLAGQGGVDAVESHLWRKVGKPGDMRTVSRASATGEASAIRDFCKWLIRRKRLLDANPVDFADLGGKDDPDPQALEPWQAERLMRAAEVSRARIVVIRRPGKKAVEKRGNGEMGRMVAYLAIALLGGLRPSEIERLTPEMVHLGDSPFIRVRKLKRGRGVRLVPMEPALAAWLTAYPSRFPLKRYRKELDRIREAAGLREDWEPDILRHTYISARCARGDSEGDIARAAGTLPDTIHTYYRALLTKADGEALLALMP